MDFLLKEKLVMPSPYVKRVAKEIGKSIEEVDKHWAESKKIASENLGKSEINFTNEDYTYVVGILKNKLGIRENIKVKDFIDSGMTAKEYVETLTSSQFSIGKIIPPVVKRRDLDDEDDGLPSQKKEDKPLPSVINLSPSTGKESLKCTNCGHKFLGKRGSACPECGGIESTSLSEVKKRLPPMPEKTEDPENVKLDNDTIHVDTKINNDGGGVPHVGESEQDALIAKEFAFLEADNNKELPEKKTASGKKLTADRIREILAQRHEMEENDDYDSESVNAFKNMVLKVEEADKKGK